MTGDDMLDSNMTMAQAFSQVIAPRRKQIALTSEGVHHTYGALQDRVNRLASALQSQGVHKGDRVAAFLPPGIDFASLFFALAEIGGVFVPLNPQTRPYTYSQVLQDADPVMVVTSQSLDEESIPLLGNLKHIISVAGEMGSNPTLQELIDSVDGEVTNPEQVNPEDLLALLYTSGTTGSPKGTMHTHRSLITPVLASIKIRELWLKRISFKSLGQTAKALVRYKTRLLRVAGRPQVFLSTVGWHSITGIELMLQALLMGDQIVAMPRFHPRHAMELMQQEKITILVAIPTAFQAMLSMEDFDSYDTSSLLICGTGAMPCPPDLGRKIQERYHCALHIGFGSTEMAGGIAVPSIADSNELQATTVGQPLPGMQVKIVDEHGQELPTGEVGELLCRGESIMQGYYNAPEATSSVIDKAGWYATGDLARLDEKGYLQIVGRKKDMIVRAGQNIYPAEIEAFLVTHPDIQEAAVVGVPSEVGGEQAWAFIILRPGAELTSRQVLDYCRKELEPYKIPNQVRFVSDFPRTEIGKPQKFRLQSDILSELRKEK
jgi:acyl-CoA synthetase (AMP-forming)/AMP-acid ligase II